jgi:ABC-type branched-subunit amino acid transport system substrate-binding protein
MQGMPPDTARRWTAARRAVLAIAGLLILAPSVVMAGALSDAERRGKRIYFEGAGRAPVAAYLDGPGVSANASAFPCAKCHLPEGPGVKEGGIQTADIRYATLTKPFTAVRPSGRAHDPYTDEDLKKAVEYGSDPAGNVLNEAHPRYTMRADDLDDLVAYLKVLGREPVPGITENEIRVGFLSPGGAPFRDGVSAVEGLLGARFDELNAQGGIFRRSLRLVPLRFDATHRESIVSAANAVVENEQVFCLIASVGVAPDDPALDVLAAGKVPVIAPIQVALDGGYGADRHTFHVFASVRDQARVIVDALADASGTTHTTIAIVHAMDRAGEVAARSARAQLTQAGRAIAIEVAYEPGRFRPAETAGRLKDATIDAVFFFGHGSDAVAFLQEAQLQQWSPVFLSLTQMVGASLLSLPPGLVPAVFLAASIPAFDPAAPDAAGFARLARAAAGDGRHTSLQVVAYAGVSLLVEGLRRAGRDVTRERFVDALGGLLQYPTGVTPPLTYGENRRTGAVGAQVFRLDAQQRQLVAVTPWREPRQ